MLKQEDYGLLISPQEVGGMGRGNDVQMSIQDRHRHTRKQSSNKEKKRSVKIMSFLARKPTDVWDRIAIPISIASKNFCEVLFASLDFWNPDAYQ